MNMFAQIGEVWDSIVAIWDATLAIAALWPWFLGCLVVGILLGAWWGWKGVLAVATLGVSVIAIRMASKPSHDPIEHPLDPKDRTPPFHRTTMPGRRKAHPTDFESLTK